MIEALNELDTRWFHWVNQHYNTPLDWTMWVLSQHWSWAVVLVLAVGLLTLRREPRQWWLVGLGLALCFLVADQGSVHLFKETVARLRPCHALEEVRMFRTGCGGRYGFVSSHAANAFAVATFLVLRYRKVRWATVLLALWAVATSYSRAYLGKHYPGDLLCGALFGILAGYLITLISRAVEKKLQKSETK
ncbi:MAG: phosphatase PAP2 family protein [Bacteroidales bacterium]|nr:phosphatase PAP2 family protein [Bacteroidales bacterium]